MIKAILFDLDGTLLNTLDDIKNSVNYMLKKHGFKERTLDEIRSFVGDGAKQMIERSIGFTEPKEQVLECLSTYEAHYEIHKADLTKPYDGVYDLLNQLKEKNIRLAVVSNKPMPQVIPLIEGLFPGYFEVILGETSELKRKPSPEMLFYAIEALELSKEDVLFVGDSDVDMQTAINANVDAIAVLWGFRDETVLKKYQPKYIVNHPKEILTIINK
ncbi:predicte haloacid dehalogenase-like hydrolase [Paracholeplasma brassicae]|uniref:Predicte haloacid dehalogenase-like hydrolase n=1 Tax=Acholeplasma brassicae TaxID=61635 RepID=U4KN75_9MOLU|nr:HAD-IA family hydrolase [Paracholeplasma brassicae]CCV65700.1 predicte haloacid dehalogenase-like hydrolase [Paracholeplasma brassicae]